MIPYGWRPLLRLRTAWAGLETILILSLLWYGFARTALAADPVETYRSPSEGILFLRAEAGTLSLEVREASLERILQEISRLADVAITSDAPLQGKVTYRAEKVALDAALKKLLKGRDMTCLYGPAKSPEADKAYRLKEVRIYLPEGKEGSGRIYSYAKPSPPTSTQRPPRGTGSSPLSKPSESQPSPALPTPTPPPLPAGHTRSQEEAKRFMTEILRAGPGHLDDIVERLKRENPEIEEQIDQFLESIEEAQQRARETGRPFPAVEDLGEIGSLLQQTLDDQPGSEEQDDDTDEP